MSPTPEPSLRDRPCRSLKAEAARAEAKRLAAEAAHVVGECAEPERLTAKAARAQQKRLAAEAAL